MISKKEVFIFIAAFIIELMIFIPFYVADIYAAEPTITNVQALPSFDSSTITWQTDISSNSVVSYGNDNLVEMSKTSSEVTTEHSIILTPLLPNLQYFYKVKSCDGSDCKSSDLGDFRTQAMPAPTKVEGLANGTITKHSIELTWSQTSFSYFKQYNIYRNSNIIANITSKSDTQYTDNGLSGGTTYQYEVSVVNSEGVEGPKSDSFYATTVTPDTTPPIIENISITSVSINSATITWSTNEEANATVKYGTSRSNLNLIKSLPEQSTTHTVTLENLLNRSTYFYSVISCDLDGNCAERSDNQPFAATEMLQLNIQITAPATYNKAIVPVTGTATPHTRVKFFVNDVYKALIGIEKNTNGTISFDVPGFTTGNNTLRAVVEDSIGNTKEQVTSVKVDISPPQLSVTPLPGNMSSENVIVNGSVSEIATIKIYIRLLQNQDSSVPSKVTNLHIDQANTNSVVLAWDNSNDTDLMEYIIYRDDIPVGTAVSSSFTDDYFVSSGRSYRYEIAAVDTNCNMGEKSVVNTQTAVGGTVYNGTIEPETIRCIDTENTPKYTLNSQYPFFREEITLEQGLNEVIIEAIDEAGNTDRKGFNVYYDSEAPEIIDTNLGSLTPASYTRGITVKGTVSEDAYVCVYINDEPDLKPYRVEEVNQSFQDITGSSRYCGNTINKSFAIDVELRRDPDYAYDAEKQTTQERSIFVNTGTAWINKIKIIAIDYVGLKSDPVEEEILYALCGSGGDWSILVSDVMPSEIVPRHLLEGMAQIGITLDLTWRGSGKKPGVTDIDVREGYPMGMSSDIGDKFDTDWVSQIPDPACSDEFDKCYILIDLKAQDPIPNTDNTTTYKQEENLSKHHQGQCFSAPFSDKSYIAKAGCVRIPLTIEINYEKERLVRVKDQYVTKKETVTQRECANVEVLIQPRIPPDVIPESFLKSTVQFLNETINLIDKILEPLEKVLTATMIACFATWAILYVKKVSEGFSCLGMDIFGAKETGCNCEVKGSDIICPKGAKEGERNERCESCVESKISTKKFETMMHWICDRVMCPSVPSYEKYVRDNKGKDSNCVNHIINYDSTTEKNENKEYCSNLPKGLVKVSGKPLTPDDKCCDEEYMQQWNSGCFWMDELKESDRLANPEKDTNQFIKIWRAVSTFKLCRPGDNDERQIKIDDQWFIFRKNENINSRESSTTSTAAPVSEANTDTSTKEEKKTFDWSVYLGVSKRERRLSDGQIINDNETIEPFGPALTDPSTQYGIKVDNCKKYVVDPKYKMSANNPLWPKYRKTESTETVTSGSNMYKSLTDAEMETYLRNAGQFDTNSKPAGNNIREMNDQVTLQDGEFTYTYKQKVNGDKKTYELLESGGIKQSGKEIKQTDLLTSEDQKNNPTSYSVGNDDKIFISTPQSMSKSTTTQQWLPVPESIVRDACSGFGEDYIADPTDTIFRSVQCVCLSALYSYLKLYRKVLGLIKDCFQTILLTGDGSSGVCKAVLSYYVCDLLFYMFSCFKGYTGFGTKGAEERGALGFLKGIVGAGAEVQQSVQERYGSTNMFRVMFVQRRIIHAACLAFFGVDSDLDLASMAEEGINLPINSAVSIFPANRRFVGFNPVDGITNHVYHTGVMIVSGSDNLKYNVLLVCSTDNRCDKNYFENGYCDCARGPKGGHEQTVDITNQFGGNGLLNQGEVINQEAFIPVSYTMGDEAHYRYDKVRVEYEYLDNTGKPKKEKVERELSQIGGSPIASCSFDIVGGLFRCNVFSEPTTACIVSRKDISATIRPNTEEEEVVSDGKIYNAVGKKLFFPFTARRQSTIGDNSKAFHATIEIKDGATPLVTIDEVIDSETEKTYTFGGSGNQEIRISESWFSGGKATSSCYLVEDGLKLNIDACPKDAIITCKRDATTPEKITFKIETGHYDHTTTGSFKSDTSQTSQSCVLDSTATTTSCNGYTIRVEDRSKVLCGNLRTGIRRMDIGETIATSNSKSLSYTLTVYRPKTDSPTTKSDIIAKCSGQLQRFEGSFTIYRTENQDAIAQAQQKTDQGKDTQKPTVSLRINRESDPNKIGSIPVADDGTPEADFNISVTDREQIKSDGTGFYSGLASVELFLDTEETPIYTKKDFTEKIQFFETTESDKDTITTQLKSKTLSQGFHTFKVIAKDKLNNVNDEISLVVYFGKKCGNTGACTLAGICTDTFNMVPDHANDQICIQKLNDGICCMRSSS